MKCNKFIKHNIDEIVVNEETGEIFDESLEGGRLTQNLKFQRDIDIYRCMFGHDIDVWT